MGQIYVRGLGTVMIDGDEPTPEEMQMIDGALSKSSTPVPKKPDPTEGMSAGQLALVGAGKFFVDKYRGAKQFSADILNKFGAVDAATVSELRKEQDERKRLDAPLMSTVAGNLGYGGAAIASSLPLMAIPGINTASGAALSGLAYGLTDPIGTGESRAKNAAISTAASVAGKYLGDKVASTVTNKIAAKQAEKLQNQARDAVLKKGLDAGLTVTPTLANPTIKNRMLEGLAGKLATAQQTAVKNQTVTNSLIKRGLGLTDDAPITPQILTSIREKAGEAYAAVPNMIPNVSTDKPFIDTVQKSAASYRRFSQQFPKLANSDIDDLLQSVSQESFDTRSVIDAVKIFREQAAANMADRTKKTLGRVQKQTADALEDLLHRNLSKAGHRDLVPKLKDARQLIAKTYSAESALNKSTGDIVARKIASQLNKKQPLTGEFKTVADFANAHPKAMQEVTSSMPGLSPLDYAVAFGGTIGTGSPLGAAGLLVRPAVRSMILSRPYQKLFAQPKYSIGMIPRGVGGLLSNEYGQAAARGLGPLLTLPYQD